MKRVNKLLEELCRLYMREGCNIDQAINLAYRFLVAIINECGTSLTIQDQSYNMLSVNTLTISGEQLLRVVPNIERSRIQACLQDERFAATLEEQIKALQE